MIPSNPRQFLAQISRFRFRRSAALALATALVILITPLSAADAESPSMVADAVANDGVFVGFGRGDDVDEEALILAVEDARVNGLRIVAIVPSDPQPTASAFARRVQEQTEADIALVFPEDGPMEAYVVEDLSASRIRATERARGFQDPVRAVEAFAAEIGSTREAGTPDIVGRIVTVLIILTLVIGVVVAIEQAVSRLKKPAKAV